MTEFRHRTFLGVRLLLLSALALVSSPGTSRAESREPKVIRLAVVNTPEDLLRYLLPEFESQSGYRVTIHSGNDCYEQARTGKADMVISHFGHPGVELFVTNGLGLWPKAIFSNQAVLVGPGADPARVRGLTDAVEAFRRIAASRSPFLANRNAGTTYLEEFLWERAGRPQRGPWYLDPKLTGADAIEAAGKKGAYTLWGLIPFLRLKKQLPLDLQPMVLRDPLLQRVMVSVVVNPKKVAGVNASGATALARYLLLPKTQAKIQDFRYPGFARPLWWPAGRHNGIENK